MPNQMFNLNNLQPPAPPAKVNVKWQADAATNNPRNISAYVDAPTAPNPTTLTGVGGITVLENNYTLQNTDKGKLLVAYFQASGPIAIPSGSFIEITSVLALPSTHQIEYTTSTPHG